MKHYYSYVSISSKTRRKQNRMTILCISIAVFLVTVIFSVVDMMVKEETARLIAKHGEAEFQSFLERPGVATLYPIAIVLFIFVLIAGSLMITSSLSFNVTERTKFFGLMRCIGMSKKQVMRIVRLECLNWCKTAIPFGIIFGTIAEWILCAILKYVVGGEFANMPQFGISLVGIISGILMGVCSVLIAAQKPARKASSVTPVSAISGVEHQKVKVFMKDRTFRIENKLGVGHALSGGRKLLLMTDSFALSIILFLCFSVILQLVDCLLPQSSVTVDIEIKSEDTSDDVSDLILTQLEKLSGIEHVFGRRSLLGQPGSSSVDETMDTVDVISYDLYEVKCLKKDGMLKSGSDISMMKDEPNACLVISDTTYKKGDTILFHGETLTVAGQLKYDIFSSDGCANGNTTVILADETFGKITGNREYAMIFVQLKEKSDEDTVAAIRTIIGGYAKLNDLRQDDTHRTYLAFKACVYMFLGVIALVAIMNIVNSISMGVSERMKQYGAMRAVGMDEGQLVRMIAAESVTYAGAGLTVGLAIGMILSHWLFDYLVTSHFPYAKWSIPSTQIVVIVVFILLALILGVWIPSRKIRKMSVTETISAL